MPPKHGLGRGLSALINDGRTEPSGKKDESASSLPVSAIARNTRQPRRGFDQESLDELAASVRERGILQPLLVRKTAAGFELIAGERRLRAAGMAGLTEVPVRIVEAGDNDSLELALIENLQREDLNPVDEAEGYQLLASDFNMTHERIAERIGKSRAAVTNALRLLNLPDEVKRGVREGKVSAGHAKLLSGLEIPQEQINLARRVIKDGLSVRELEKMVLRLARPPRRPRASRDDVPAAHLAYLSENLQRRFGTAVRIESSRTLANGKKRKGVIEMDFYSDEDLDRILGLLGMDGAS